MKPALHFPRIGKTLLAAALVAMAGTAAADQSLLGKLGSIFGASSETKAAASKGIEGDIDAAKALAFLYGNMQTTQGEKEQFDLTPPMPLSKEWALWKNPQCSNVKYIYLDGISCPQEARVHSVFDAKYTEQGKEKYIMLTKTGDAPNMQNPEIFGAAVFVKEGGQWTLEVENKYISPEVAETRFGCRLDSADKPVLARVGPDKHGILIHAVGSGWGHDTCPTVLLPYGGSIRSVLISVFEYGYTPTWVAQEGGEYGVTDARASFDEKSAGEYYDAVVRYIDVDKKRKAASRRFQFRDGEYHEVATPKAANKGGKKGAKKRK